MLFPTFAFAFFFLAVFVLFWYVYRKPLQRKLLLIAASYLYYAFWDWRFCFLLLAVTAANFGFAHIIGQAKDHVWRKAYMVFSVIVNLSVLGFFKYYNFFAESTNELIRYFAGKEGLVTFAFPALRIIMPVGISFYIFKVMSYVFDVYLCRMQSSRSFLDTLIYVSFFPQLASGPITPAKDFFPQLQSPEGVLHSGITPDSKPLEFSRASMLIASGLVKKLVFANFLSTLFVDPVFLDPSLYNTLEVVLAAVGYSVVIYTDFSGYSDLAIGIALLLGFQTPVNFNRPYISFSVTEFWKRWHMTFSAWLRDYLYFSMGGSRFGKVRTLFALFFTMMLGGLWHGSAWNFLLWGAMQGTALALERAFNYGNKRSPTMWKAALQILLTFSFVTLSWIVFRAPGMRDIGAWFVALAGFSKPLTLISPLIVILIVLGIGMHAIPLKVRSTGYTLWLSLPLPVKVLVSVVFFSFLAAISMSAVPPFIYFQF